MVSTIKLSPEPITKMQEPENMFFGPAEEFIAQCPSCKTIETVSINSNSRLIATRKFYQSGRNVYHKCGSTQPCRLFRGR